MDGLIIGVVLVITLFVAFLIEKKPWGWKGYEISASWRERGLQGISAFWARITDLKKLYILFASIIGFALLVLFFALYFLIFSILFNPNETKEFDSNFALAFLGTVSGFGALFGVYLAIQRTDESKRQSKTAEREATTAEQGLITDRLNKATKNLGTKDGVEPVLEIRLGALQELERVAQDSIRHHISVMEILCAYIRINSKLDNSIDAKESLRADIGVAINIIARRDKWLDGKKRIEMEQSQKYRLDLRNCDLHGIILENANLSYANFSRTNLSNATFFNSNLNYANLNESNMENLSFMAVKLNNANLKDSRLMGADLFGVELNNANIRNANMTYISTNGAKFNDADLYNASLNEAYILYSEFKGADFGEVETEEIYINGCDLSDCKGLTQEQLDAIFCGYEVEIPSGLEQPEHWPTDEASFADSNYTYHEEKRESRKSK